MDGWEAPDVGEDSDIIWACQNTALDHYEKHPTSSEIQDNVFESSMGKNMEAIQVNGNERRTTPGFEKLIDIETPTSSSFDDSDEDDQPKFNLITRQIDGKKLLLIREDKSLYPSAQKRISIEETDCVIEKGSIVRELDECVDDRKIINYLNKIKGMGMAFASDDRRFEYGTISSVYLVKLKLDEVRFLRPLEAKNRFELHHDFARFTFVRHLKKGDEVDFKEGLSGEMRRGFISSRDRNDRGDFVFSVGMHPPRDRRMDMDRGTSYRFYDDYEGNEHEGSMIYQVSSDRLFPPSHTAFSSLPTGRVEVPIDREWRRPESPPRREGSIPVRVTQSPPGFAFVSPEELEENRDGLYHKQSGEWYRLSPDEVKELNNTAKKVPIRPRNRSVSPPREKIIPIRVLDGPPSVVGGGNRIEENRQGPYRNLSSELEARRPPPTKPRTKFDLPLSQVSQEKLPSFGSHINRSTAIPSTAFAKTNGTESVSRYVPQEGDWKMNERARNDEYRDNGREKKEKIVAKETFSIGSCEGWRAGDRCLWNNDGRTSEATVRWIGRLRGHASVYAGLEFDDAVGQGTGMYQGSELFHTQANHAGFVMLSTINPVLISTSSNVHPSTFQTQDQTRERSRDNEGRNEGPSLAFHKSYPVEDRVGNVSPPIDVPISGQGAMIPPLYRENAAIPSTSGVSTAFSARHRPLPPPPSYDQSTAQSLRPSPPSVPPRPTMLPEDYMIESFDVGSCVDVCYKGSVRSGVVRWKGDALNNEMDKLETSVIVELESAEAPPDGWRQSMESGISGVDHTLSTVIVPLHSVRRDRRFAKDSSPLMGNGSSMNGYGGEGMRGQDFGSIDSGVETSKREPWGGSDELIGRMKGIQGHRNSCYLDSMLYLLFVQCMSFDEILTRRRNEKDIREYDELVRILSTEIVWPLRRFHYVRADHVMKLRKELEKALPNIKGLTSEEKDPEEILSSLFRDVFKTKPYLNLINSKTGKIESTWLYHVVVEEWQSNIASSQHLLERSLRKDHTKFAECPQVFIMQLPRYGVTKLFDKIVPLEKIDLTPFINNTVFACAQCNKNAAELYCHECYLTKETLYGEVCYCVDCFRSVHMREGLTDHADRPVDPPSKPTKKITRYTFTLSGVLAIETSHYVSFVRSSHGRWLFFDSMADREGLQNGFNIPQVKECGGMGSWLSLSGYQRLRSSVSPLPLDDPLVNRLLSDSYICIYTADQPTITSSNSTTSLLSKLTKEFKISKS